MRPRDDQGHRVIPVVDWLLETTSLCEFLQRLAHEAVETVPGAHGCDVTVQRRHRPLTVVGTGGTGGIADRQDEDQHGQDDSPSLQVLRTGRIVHAPDLREEHRWGSYPAYASSLGIRSVLSLPVGIGGDTAGALSLYGTGPGVFTHRDEELLVRFAAQAGGGIALAQRLADAEGFSQDLQTAMRSRAVIDQAIGAVMQQRQCDADEAFAILRDLSQRTNLKLREVCTRLLTSLSGRPPEHRPPLRPRP
ncbi:GAF and ANTAR domain-containing protein [Streptomyces sp. NPDC096198]|uniref:GAF and ANTAR domain-containing protein n=1 Tax=Streptomyces sp. NPDC096198 TaxID=3366080 RepID=UPI0037FAED82